jgi:hypothetical protein
MLVEQKGNTSISLDRNTRGDPHSQEPTDCKSDRDDATVVFHLF